MYRHRLGLELHLQSEMRNFTTVLIQLSSFLLLEITIVIENHPSIARAASLISLEKIVFPMVLYHAYRGCNHD